ncbi:MAG: histidine kinase N-terminal 7TM domain-containing protein [Halohasta sp.]
MGVSITALVGGVLAIGGAVGLGVAYIALRHRDHPASGPLAWISAPPGLAGLGYAVLTVVPDSPAAGAVLAVGTGLMVITVGYFPIFVLTYIGRGEWLTARRRLAILGYFGLLAVVSVVDVLGQPVVIETVNGLTFPVLPNRTEGVVFVVAAVSAYASVFVGTGLLGRFLISSRNMYRKQTAVIFGAIFLTAVGGVVYEAGINFHPGLNLNSVFYSIETLLIALALFRYEFLNVEPLAPEVVLERMDDPVFVLDDDSRIVDTNPAARGLVSTPDPVGMPIEELLPGLLDAASADQEFVPSVGGGPAARSDGGSTDVYDCNAAPISDQYDRDRGTVVVLRDISVQKQRERTLERLQETTRRFLGAETADEVCEIAVTVADELLGYPYSGAMLYDEEADVLRAAAFADPLVEAFDDAGIDDDSAELTVDPGETDIWRVFETGEPMGGEPIDTDAVEIPVEIGGSLLYPLGEWGVLGISAGPDHEGFSDDDRRFIEVLASTTENALERVTKERELRESRELLATRNDQIEFFNSVLRHDLLNAMQILRGHTDMLADSVAEELRPHVEVIDDYSDDIVDLTRNVRAVTSSVAEESSTLEPVDPGALLAEVVSKTHTSHDDVTVTVAVDLDSLPSVQGNEFLAAVFENLLGNAVEHNDSDHVEIDIDADIDTETVTVRIADNGPGIDDAAKQAVFERSTTSENSGSIGFGLYFVRVMVERYGGGVWFEDRDDGRGAVAVVELPRADADEIGTELDDW